MIRAAAAAAVAAVVAVALAAPAAAQSFPSPSRTFKLCWMEDPACMPMVRAGYQQGHALACRGRSATLDDDRLFAVFLQFGPSMVSEMNNFPPGDWRQIWGSYARDLLSCL